MLTEIQRVALIPAYEPEDGLVNLVVQLSDAHFKIVLVDDGSGEQYRRFFSAAKRFAVVLTHEENRGKGCALRTGLSYIARHCSANAVVVTLDADGQHSVTDAVRAANEAAENPGTLVLGCRRFDGKDVPARSRFGNRLTCLVYRLATGAKVSDTQTGLRAFTMGLVPFLLGIEGDRYEYEMNVLLACPRRKIPLREIAIETIYENGNACSHFNALRDSLRIYGDIFKFALSSFTGFAVDYGLYTLLTAVMGGLGAVAIPLANVLARIVSAWVNFSINRKYVFKTEEKLAKTALQYFGLAAIILAGNTVLLSTLVGAGMNKYLAKVLTEIMFFTLSWAAQKFIIFPKKEESAEELKAELQ